MIYSDQVFVYNNTVVTSDCWALIIFCINHDKNLYWSTERETDEIKWTNNGFEIWIPYERLLSEHFNVFDNMNGNFGRFFSLKTD